MQTKEREKPGNEAGGLKTRLGDPGNETRGLGMRLGAWEWGWEAGNEAGGLGTRLDTGLPGAHLCIVLDVAVFSEWCRTFLWVGTSWEVPVPMDAVQTSALFSGPCKEVA